MPTLRIEPVHCTTHRNHAIVVTHNGIRDITATLLIEKNCQNVATEPALQQLDSETIVLPIATVMLSLIFAHEVSGIEVKRLKTRPEPIIPKI